MTGTSRAVPFARSIGELVREATISILVGVSIVCLVSIGESSRLSLRTASYGALIGIFVYAACALLGVTCGGWVGRMDVLSGKLVRAGMYFVGGCVGWLLATILGNAIGLVHVPLGAAALRLYTPLAGLLALGVGLSFYAYGLMRDRLEASVARLKEAEFAEKELEVARAIQERILPPPELSGEGYRIAARNLPARFVAGDFYDFFNLPDGALGIVVADVSGKGIGASLIMASVKTALPFLAAERAADETLREANRRLKPKLEAREFVALACVRYEPKTGAFTVANAGLPDPYVLRANGSVAAVSVPGPRFPLGVRQEVAYEAVSGRLAPGDRLLLLTDGLPEAPTSDGGPLGYERLEAMLPRAATPDALFDLVRAAAGPVLADDWTVLFLERLA